MADVEEAFATVEELEARWHKLTQSEQAVAASKLLDATDILKARCTSWAKQPKSRLARIVCAMVKRSMIADVQNPNGFTQMSQGVGAFSESGTFANPTGDLYPLKSELDDLGVGVEKAFIIQLDRG